MELAFFLMAVLVTAIFGCFWMWQYQRRKKVLMEQIRSSFGQDPSRVSLQKDTTNLWKLWRIDDAWTIDDQSWSDLGMDEVYLRLDSCESAIGKEYLYAALRRPLGPQTSARRNALRAAMEQNPEIRFALQLKFARLGRYGRGFEELLGDPKGARLPLARVYPLCAALPWLCLPLLFFGPQGGLLCLGAVCLNIALSVAAKPRLEGALQSLGYLAACFQTAQRVAKLTSPCAPELSKELEDSLKPLRGLTGALSAIACPAPGTDAGTFQEVFGMLTLWPLLFYGRAVKILELRKEQALQVCRLMGETELAIATASFCASVPGWCTPTWQKEGEAVCVECQELYHPLLSQPVKNSARFSQDTLFTGSNASGKSTFLKAVAVNAILAGSLGVCCAERFCLPYVPIISSMAVRDDLLAGESYFIAELRSLLRLIQQAEAGPCLCFVDEILKGTNTVERIAASAAVLERLHTTKALCFVATHDGELTRMLTPFWDNRHFREQVTEDGVHFDYHLYSGPSSTRNAIALLKTM
ncbi:hypothetical protein, partial [uncultured Ruthenibacterium sp.]|uniref:MutS-related protein n=1 Tax=uncultured Ruthenibacterium sp. TaxID=1905347 RepID=UPI00349EA9FF